MTTTPRTECEKCGAATDGALCWECIHAFAILLGRIVGIRRGTSSPFDIDRQLGLARELVLTATRQGIAPGNRGGRSSGEQEHPIPVDLRAGYAAQALDRALGDALEYVGTWPHDMPTAERASELQRLLPTLRRHRGAAEHLRAVGDAVERAEGILEPVRRQYVGPCSAKVGREADQPCPGHLRAAPDAETVTCQECGTGYTIAEVRAQLAAAAAEQLLPAHDIARALTATNGEAVAFGTVRQWVLRSRLPERGRNEAGRPLYRVADAQALLAAQPTRRNAG